MASNLEGPGCCCGQAPSKGLLSRWLSALLMLRSGEWFEYLEHSYVVVGVLGEKRTWLTSVFWRTRRTSCVVRAPALLIGQGGGRPVVVGLTSYPARIATVHRAVRSLFGQTRLPDKIVLYLAAQDFPGREKDLPEPLTSMLWHDFEIRWVEKDLKSHKKYYWALEEFADGLVVTGTTTCSTARP